MKPRLLDLFCGAGGCANGYADAGFEVIGVDIAPQKNYPYSFYRADALDVLNMLLDDGLWQGYTLDDFVAIHASPPCQGYSRSRHIRKNYSECRDHPLLLGQVRKLLNRTGLLWVMENVAEAPMSSFLMLCGTQFGLKVYRHRQFESSHLLLSPGRCRHPHALLPGYVCVYGNHVRGRQTGQYGNHYERFSVTVGRSAMDIDWMTQGELSQAIPPAYTRWIGLQLLDILARNEAA